MKSLFAKERTRLSSSATIRTIAQGAVVGLVADNGTHVWRGLPFAASTAGANRWRAPQPAPAWEGRLEALSFAERCAQLTNEFDADEGLKPGLVVGSEDCLGLDVYAPADARDRALPVMDLPVWPSTGKPAGRFCRCGRLSPRPRRSSPCR
jgi:para-nitrobenzyl esterase